jgi:hypothetical protein
VDPFTDFLTQLTPKFFLDDPQRVRSNAYIAFLAMFAVSFIAGVAMTVFAKQLSKGNRVHRGILERYGTALGWVGGAGLIIVAVRYADVQLFSKRLWTALDLLALLIVIGHFVHYRIRKYPQDIAEYDEEARRRRYLPVPTARRTQLRAARRRR